MNTDSAALSPDSTQLSIMHLYRHIIPATKLPKLLSNFSTFIALLYTLVINRCLSLFRFDSFAGPVKLRRQSTLSPLREGKHWHCCSTRCKNPWPASTTVRRLIPSQNNWRRPFWSKLMVSLITLVVAAWMRF